MEIIEYLDYIKFERKLSNETVKNYEYDLNKFISYLKENHINSFNKVTVGNIENYLKYISNLNSRSISRNITSINNLFIFLLKEKRVKKNPCEFIDRPKIKKSLPDTLSVEEVSNLLDIPLKTKYDYRNVWEWSKGFRTYFSNNEEY